MEQEHAIKTETADSLEALSIAEWLKPESAVLSIAQVVSLTSLSKQTLYREINAKRFPAPVRLTTNRVGWRVAEVNAWLAHLELAA